MNRSFFSTHRSSCVVLFPLLLGCGPAEPDASGWKDLPLDSGVPAGNGGVSVTDGASRAPDGASVANGGAATVDADHCASGGALHDVRAYMADGHGAELVARGPIYGAPGPASVQKLDAHCNPTWTYAVPATDTLWSFRLAVDDAGAVVVAGSLSAASEPDAHLRDAGALFLMKLDPGGHLLWRAVSPQAGHLARLVLDPGGDVVASGRAQDGSGSAWDVVVRHDGEGQLRWQKPFGDARARVADVALDGAGAVLVAGRFAAPFDFGGGVLSPTHTAAAPDGFDAFLARYEAAGTHAFSQRFGDERSQSLDRVSADAAGQVTVRGRGSGVIDLGGGPLALGEDGTFAAGFDAAGNHVWSAVEPPGG